MNAIHTTIRGTAPRSRPSWPVVLAWSLCGDLSVQALLMLRYSEPEAFLPALSAAYLLRPVALFCAILVLLDAARQPRRAGRRWLFNGVALLFGVVTALLRQTVPMQELPLVIPAVTGLFPPGVDLAATAHALHPLLAEILQELAGRQGQTLLMFPVSMLYLWIYLVALVGSALYFPHYRQWLGTTLRLGLDSAVIGGAVLVLLAGMLAGLLHGTYWDDSRFLAMLYIAGIIGLLFAVGALNTNPRWRGSPLILLLFCSLLCIAGADGIRLLLPGLLADTRWLVGVTLAYALHNLLFALAACLGSWRPPHLPEASLPVASRMAWLVWAFVPRILLFVAMSVAFATLVVPRELILALLAVSIAREALIAYEHQRLFHLLHDVQDQATESATQTRAYLSRMIHDVTSPIQGLWNVAHCLSEEPLRQTLRAQLVHLDSLIDQSRCYLQVRSAVPCITRVDLAPICGAAIQAALERADARGVVLRLAFETDDLLVYADATAVRRILDNLLANAIAVTGMGDEVELRVYASPFDGMLVLAVRDTGAGVPAAQQAQIFEPRVSLSGGSGLGLAIVRELVTMLHGTYGMESKVGDGSIFWVRLPQAVERGHKVVNMEREQRYANCACY